MRVRLISGPLYFQAPCSDHRSGRWAVQMCVETKRIKEQNAAKVCTSREAELSGCRTVIARDKRPSQGDEKAGLVVVVAATRSPARQILVSIRQMRVPTKMSNKSRHFSCAACDGSSDNFFFEGK